jgi:hypothetical protein
MAASALTVLSPPRRTGDDGRDLIQLFDWAKDLHAGLLVRDSQIAIPQGRTVLTEPTTFFCNPDGQDLVTYGETRAKAFKTTQFAYEFLASNIDTARHQVTVKLAPGNYQGLRAEGALLGQDTLQPVLFEGEDLDHPELVVCEDVIAFKSANGAAIATSGLTVKGTWAIAALLNGYVAIKRNTAFGEALSTHMLGQYNGTVEILADYKIVGSAPRHAWGTINGNVISQGHTVTIENGPLINDAFAMADMNAVVQHSGATFEGSLAIGSRKFRYETGGGIDSGGSAGANFPGSVAGVNPDGTGWIK